MVAKRLPRLRADHQTQAERSPRGLYVFHAGRWEFEPAMEPEPKRKSKRPRALFEWPRPAAEGEAFPVPLADVPKMVPVGVRIAGGVSDRGFRRIQFALRYPLLGVNAANARGVLLFDCDEPERARAAIESGAVPRPSWSSVSTDTGRFHAAYVLADAVHLGSGSLAGPSDYAAAVECALCAALSADLSYTGRLTYNPWFPDLMRKTEWGQVDGRSLRELVPACGLPKQKLEAEEAAAWGRNCALFGMLCREAEPLAFALRWEEAQGILHPLDASLLVPQLRACAERIQRGFVSPLGVSEVEGIIRSVCRYAVKWTHWRRIRGRERGRIGGLRSGEARRERASARDARIVLAHGEGWTQAEIAEAEGLAQPTISRILGRYARTVQG